MLYLVYKINGVQVVDYYNGTIMDSKRRIAHRHCVGLDDIKLIKVSHQPTDIVSNRHL